MKKLTLPIILFFIGMLVIYSCKKDFGKLLEADKQIDGIDWAKAYYAQSLEKQTSFEVKLMNNKNISTASELKSNKKTPNWKQSSTGVSELYSYVEIPLKYEHKISPTINISKNPNANPVANIEIIDASFDRLIIYKDKKGKINERIVSFVPDADYLRRHKGDISHNRIDRLDKDFFGYLHYKDWEGKALFILRIENGKAIKKYAGFTKNTTFNQNLQAQKQSNKVAVAPDDGGVNCTYLVTWDWYQDCYYATPESTTPTHCDPVVVYNVDYILLSCPPPSGGGGGPSPEPDPDPEIIDCYNPVYFYTAECKESQPDTPCKHAKKLAKDALFRAKFKLIKDDVSGSVEKAFVFKFSDNSYDLRVGDANSVDVSMSTAADGFFHNHCSGANHYGSFGMDDVGAMYDAYANGMMIDTKTFTIGVATAEGTYILKIDDLSAFQTWGATNFGTGALSLSTKTSFETSWTFLSGIYGNGKGSELALLSMLESSGLKLFKGDANLTKWQAIRKNLTNIINTDCNEIE